MSTDERLVKTEARPLVHADEQSTILPLCDVYENDSEVLVVADLPGATPDTLRVNFERGELSLWARRDTGTPEGELVRSEYGDAVFERRFTIPDGIDASKISAELKDGVLRLKLPKSEAVKPRQIQVRAG